MQQRAWTANFENVSRAADTALSEPDGVDITFSLQDFGTPEACQHAARSFQKSFTALRSRENKKAEVHNNESGKNILSVPIVSNVHGTYSSLSCAPKKNEDGSWTVSLIPARLYLAGMKITSRSTGEAIELDNPLKREFEVLIRLSMKKEFTHEQFKRLSEVQLLLTPNIPSEEMWNWQDGKEWRPASSTKGYRPALIINSPFDAANVSLEDMFGEEELPTP